MRLLRKLHPARGLLIGVRQRLCAGARIVMCCECPSRSKRMRSELISLRLHAQSEQASKSTVAFLLMMQLDRAPVFHGPKDGSLHFRDLFCFGQSYVSRFGLNICDTIDYVVPELIFADKWESNYSAYQGIALGVGTVVRAIQKAQIRALDFYRVVMQRPAPLGWRPSNLRCVSMTTLEMFRFISLSNLRDSTATVLLVLARAWVRSVGTGAYHRERR